MNEAGGHGIEMKRSEAQRGRGRRRLNWRHALLISLALHGIVLSGVSLYFQLYHRPSQTGTEMGGTGGGGPGGGGGKPAKISDVGIEYLIAQERRLTQSMDDEARLAYLKKKAAGLIAISNPRSIREIADRIKKLFPTPERAYAPAEAPPEGAFRTTTALPYAIAFRRDERGREVVRYTMIDADGRSLTVDMHDAAGSRAHRTAAAAYEVMQSSPLLLQVYRDVALPFINWATLSEQGSPSPGD